MDTKKLTKAENDLVLSKDQEAGVKTFLSFLQNKDQKELVLIGNAGCVDMDTEYLSPTGWKKISEYIQGEKVCQWFTDGTTEYVIPTNYIKEPCNKLNHIKSNTIDMVVSDNHRIPCITSKGNHQVKECKDFIKLSTSIIPRYFTLPDKPNINLSDELIRVLIMQTADGTIINNPKFKITINVKKERKQLRTEYLLNKANIPFTVLKSAPGYKRYYYSPPKKIAFKSLKLLWNCSASQLKVIADEMTLWDGSKYDRTNVTTHRFTGNNFDADLFQLASSSCSGNYVSKYTDNRSYVKQPLYNVSVSSRKVSTYDKNKAKVTKFIPKDGFQYCFITSSSFWLARRNGKIFPTGNSGKTTLVKYLVQTLRANSKTMELLLGKNWKYSLYFTATTNKAAQVLSELLGEETSTIHSLLSLRVVNNFKTGDINLVRSADYKILHKAIIFIDEVSMCNEQLLTEIRDATTGCKIVYIGDSHQLAPVKRASSSVFDIPNQIKLTTPHRQEKGSPIKLIATSFKKAVNKGKFPVLKSNAPSVNVVNGSSFEAAVQHAYLNNVDAKIITWTNNKAIEYNTYIRELLGHSDQYEKGELLIANSPIIIAGKHKAKTDQVVKVTSAKQAEEHGITGMSLEIDNAYTVFQANDFTQAKAIINHYYKTKDWKKYFTAKEFFVDLRPGYASTIYKVQGATHHTIFVDVADFAKCTHDNQIARMLYVGTSRATNKLYLHGSLPKRLYD